MKFELEYVPLEKIKFDTVIVTHNEDTKKVGNSIKILSKLLSFDFEKLIHAKEFKGKESEFKIIYNVHSEEIRKIVLVGLGPRKKFDMNKLRAIAGSASRFLRDNNIKEVVWIIEDEPVFTKNIDITLQSLVEGLILGHYKFDKYKTKIEASGKSDIAGKSEEFEEKKALEHVRILIPSGRLKEKAKKGIKTGEIIGESVSYARNLAGDSGTFVPETFLKYARELAKEHKLSMKAWIGKELEKERFGGTYSVGKGSANPPCFIELEYAGAKDKPYVIIGKGITFDSGGISIKPSEGMDKMRYDKSGASIVLGVMKAVAELKLPIHLIGLIPSAENLPSGTAFKPGDIIKVYSGKTVEIFSTDAEGRLLLADALGYAEKLDPKAVIDLATLTGAIVIALGTKAAGLMGTDRNLIQELKKSAELTGERVWEMPLYDEFSEEIKSDFADLKNVGLPREAGALTAGTFLKAFTEKYKWAHIDIAGVAWNERNDNGYIPKGPTAFGVRLLLQYLMSKCAKMR